MENIQDLIQFLVCILFLIRNLKSEIPNITGYTSNLQPNSLNHGGALYAINDKNTTNGDTWNNWCKILYLDASRSSNRYGDYTEVNPLYNSTLMLIKF